MPKRLIETSTHTKISTGGGGGNRRLIQLISPGWGSSGYYSSTVLEQAVSDEVFPAGLHMYADHPTEAEALERPGRSIKDLMAVTRSPARLATEIEIAQVDGPEVGAIVAEVEIVPAWADLINVAAQDIGVSIRGDATDIVEGEAEGRTGRIVEGLAHVASVDFVTRAGRGGKVLNVMESAATNRRALDHGISEATVNDTREALGHELSDAYGGKDRGAYVRDFDDSTVWFEVYDNGDSGLYAQTYTETDGVVELTGERDEVRAVTNYVSVTRPDSNTPTTTESLEDNMAKIQIEESEHTRLTETAGRVDALEAENVTLKAENTTLKESKAAGDRRTRAMDLIREHEHGFSPLEAKGLVVDLPLTEGGDFDEVAFGTQLAEHAATAAAAKGAGRITSMGQTTDTSKTTTEAAPKRTTNAWGRPLSEQKGA